MDYSGHAPNVLRKCLGQSLLVCARRKVASVPGEWDGLMVEIMADCYAEFWTLVKEDGEYPPIAEDAKPEYEDITKHLEKTNQDLAILCSDYFKWAGQNVRRRLRRISLKTT